MRPAPSDEEAGQSRRRHGPALGWLAMLLVALYPLIEVVRIVAGSFHRLEYGDSALITLDARRAARLEQLVGPYSREGFHHAGPAVFYILAPFVTALGSGPGDYLGSMVISGLALVATVALVWRWSGPLAAVWAVVALGVFCLCVRVFVLREPWNPYEVVAPMALLGFLAAGAAAGRRGAFVWAAAVASYEVQTHISTGPVAVVLVAAPAAVLALRALRARRSASHAPPRDTDAETDPVTPSDTSTGAGGARRRPALATLFGGVALAAIWVPAAVEVIKDRPNNLTLLWDFYTSPHPYPTLLQAFKAAANALAIVPFGNTPYVNDLTHPMHDIVATAVGLVVAFVAAATVVWRRRQAFAGALLAAAGVVAGVGTYGLSRASGGINSYFATWMATSPLLILLALIVGLTGAAAPRRSHASHPQPRRAVPPGAVLGILAALVATGVVVHSDLRMQSVRQVSLAPQVAAGQFAAIIEQQVGPGQRVGLVIGTDSVWPQVAGVALELDRHGIAMTVSPAKWTLEFGAQTAPGPKVVRAYRFYSVTDALQMKIPGQPYLATDAVAMFPGAPGG